MTQKRQTPIPEYKKKLVAELADLIKNKKTILLASVKNLPGPQYQQIVKGIRGKAVVKLPKKNLFVLAIEEVKNKELKKLEEVFVDNTAVLFSDSDSFDLALDLLKNKSPSKAKIGQEAPEDIRIEAGLTDLPPGPAISEFGAVGLQVEVKNGKISIKEPKVIVKKGKEITKAACDIMSKLDIKPFSIGFIPLSSYDTKENKFYEKIEVDIEGTIAVLKEFYGKALAFAVEIGYSSEDTIKFLLRKAVAQEKVLENEEKPAEAEAPQDVPQYPEGHKSAELGGKTQTPTETKSDGEEK